jgi:hypothetical protein
MKYRIEIPKPCNENWSEMTSTEKGMFCSKCKKEVVDYTFLSNYELARKINQKEIICGRFLSSQINIDLNYSKPNLFQRTGFLLGFSSLFIVSPVFSQIKKDNVEIVEKNNTANITEQKDYVEITGIVSDDFGPIPGVNVIHKNTNNQVSSDFDGKFLIKILVKDFEQKVFLDFQFIGMKTEEIEVFKNKTELKVEMTNDGAWLGEAVFVSKKPNIFKRFVNLFRK